MNFVKAQLEKAERFVETVEQKVAERVVKVDDHEDEEDDFGVGRRRRRPKVVLSDDSENDFDEADEYVVSTTANGVEVHDNLQRSPFAARVIVPRARARWPFPRL